MTKLHDCLYYFFILVAIVCYIDLFYPYVLNSIVHVHAPTRIEFYV